MIAIAGRPQQAVHAVGKTGDDREPPCGAFWFLVCYALCGQFLAR